MKNPNVRILLAAAALIVLVAVVGITAGQMDPAALLPSVPNGLISPAPPAADENTLAYARVQVNNEVLPLIPLTDGGEYTVAQEGGTVNVLRTTREGVVMHSSTCDNQNCVQQGEVTLNNRLMRVMGNLIVCLPNQVVVELVDAGEIPQPES